MEVTRENNIVRIKGKMTEIRRAAKADGKGRIYHNYYNNCDYDEEIFAVYGKNTVVLWDDDDGVTRGYFYSSDEGELIDLLGVLPEECVVDIITRNGNEYADIMEKANITLHRVMHRFVCDTTEETKKKICEREALMADVYRPENVRSATEDDLELVYNKLHEVFDADISHLPTRDKLLDLIEKKWVSLYFENEQLKALHIFKIEAAGRNYGYQTWNGAGVECYYTVLHYSTNVYLKYLEDHGIDRDKVPPGYAWADITNKQAVRGIKYAFAKPDGLIDFVYKKFDVQRDTSIARAKDKMTEILRRAEKAAQRAEKLGKKGRIRIYSNYYDSCDNDKEVFAVYGKNTVILWDDDDGTTRGYFYSSDEGELATALRMLPKDCVVNISARNRKEYEGIMKKANVTFCLEDSMD